MFNRFNSIMALAAAFTLTALVASAAEPMPFNQQAFMKAKDEGKTVLVDFHANWCPVCQKQATVIPGVLKSDTYQNVVVFTADFDSEKKLKRQLKVNHQATLVVFKGDKEVGRETGITAPEAIEKLLSKGM